MPARRTTHLIADCLERRLRLSTKNDFHELTFRAQSVTSRLLAARLNVTCLALLLTLCLAGCEVASSGDDEHHHHDHHRTTFPESVAEIQWRSAQFTSDEVPTNAALHESKRKKLLDILQRLPELAADTELKMREWDRVAAISNDLLILLQPTDAASEKDQSVARSRIKPLIAELEQLVPLSVSSVLSGGEPSPKK